MENDLWFLSTLSTVFLLAMFVFPNLNTIFHVLSSFFFFSGYLLLNHYTHYI